MGLEVSKKSATVGLVALVAVLAAGGYSFYNMSQVSADVVGDTDISTYTSALCGKGNPVAGYYKKVVDENVTFLPESTSSTTANKAAAATTTTTATTTAISTTSTELSSLKISTKTKTEGRYVELTTIAGEDSQQKFSVGISAVIASGSGSLQTLKAGDKINFYVRVKNNADTTLSQKGSDRIYLTFSDAATGKNISSRIFTVSKTNSKAISKATAKASKEEYQTFAVPKILDGKTLSVGVKYYAGAENKRTIFGRRSSKSAYWLIDSGFLGYCNLDMKNVFMLGDTSTTDGCDVSAGATATTTVTTTTATPTTTVTTAD